MSGYFEYSKSNNAIEAESMGRFPASVLAKRLRVKAGAIKAMMHPTEWHHTSKHYNATNYYDESEAQEMLAELQAWKEPAKDEQVFENCTGSYLEWTGTRNHPYARKVAFGPCRVTKKGSWYTLELPSGPIRKNENTRGFILKPK